MIRGPVPGGLSSLGSSKGGPGCDCTPTRVEPAFTFGSPILFPTFSLGSPGSRRVYEFALNQFIVWYCSEPRLAFNRIVVTRYRMYLESRGLAANTINQQLAAVRRLAHEAADARLLSPELAAGISRVKGVKQLGFRTGNWLSAEECSAVLSHANGTTLGAKRDYAMLAVLFGCGLRRSELGGLEMNKVQMRQGHWAVVDLIGKGGHIRTVPIPIWVKAALDEWTAAAGIVEGRGRSDRQALGRRNLAECGRVRGEGMLRESRIRAYCTARPAAPARSCATPAVAKSSRFNSCLATPPCRQLNAISAASRTWDIP